MTKTTATTEPASQVRVLRIRKGFSQEKLAAAAGLHRNSLRKIENGETREVTRETAASLATALDTTVEELGLRVRRDTPPPSLRLRQLSAEQRALLEEVLALPPEEFEFIRKAMQEIRDRPRVKRKRG